MKVGLDRKTIIKTAADIADRKGSSDVSIKELAEELGIRSPSLYKHFSGGLTELNKELMLYGWRNMESELINAVTGKSKDDAIIAFCYAYRDFVSKHKGSFEAMQWYNMHRSEEHLQTTEKIVAVLFRVLDAYSLTEEQKIHTVRMLRGFIQGFTTIESNGGFGGVVPPDASFDFTIKTILNGIADLQGKTKQ